MTPVAAVSLLRFSTCALVCPRIFFYLFYPGFFVTHFHAPISMACSDTLPSDPSFLLMYLEQLQYESDSDGDEFEGYLGPDDGSVIIRAIDSSDYEDQEPQSPPYRSCSLDSLTVIGQECESPLPSISPSLTPMHLGTPDAAYSLATHNHLLHIVLGLSLGLMLRLRPIGLVLYIAA